MSSSIISTKIEATLDYSNFKKAIYMTNF
jgi:hypothetical protein